MSGNTGIIEIAPTNGGCFPNALSNDFILCSSNIANVWIGASNANNHLQVGSNATFTSNLNVSGTTTLSNLIVKQIKGTTSVVQAYPPAPMTGNTTNIQNTSYGAGTYVASASTVYGITWPAYSAYDQNANTGWSSDHFLYSNGLYSGSISTTNVFSTTYAGEWIQLQLPVPIILNNYSIQSQPDTITNVPVIFVLLGSMDGKNWYDINSQTGQTSWTAGVPIAYNVSTQHAFIYFRLVCNKINNTGSGPLQINGFTLYGTQSSINITPDGQVGIGVTNPTQALEVAGNAIVNGNISSSGTATLSNMIVSGTVSGTNGVKSPLIIGGYSLSNKFTNFASPTFTFPTGGNFGMTSLSMNCADYTRDGYGWANSITSQINRYDIGQIAPAELTLYGSQFNVCSPSNTSSSLSVQRVTINDYTFKVGTGVGTVNNTGSANQNSSIMYIGSANGRSINAAGTVNVNGADYAEYMSKNGDFFVAKGDIIGIDSNDMITNKYTEAIAFGIKSTNPSYVGGDTWGSNIGTMPIPSTYHHLDQDPSYLEDIDKWNNALQLARSNVDRIAFCGKVPVNIYNASPGDYIIPVLASDGVGISGSNVTRDNMTFPLYMSVVGQVLSVMTDGRAFVLVK